MNNHPSPLVSIITVVYNAESYIKKTIESVLSQTYQKIDYIIIDGGSNDRTIEIVKSFGDRIRWISENDNGIYDAMNKGLKLAKGEWVNFLNGGDYFCDNLVIDKIFNEPYLEKYNFIYGDSINVRGESKKYISASEVSRSSLRYSSGLCHQAMFVRKEFAIPYDLRFKYKAEYNWIIDIAYRIPESSIIHKKYPVVYYALGGFSEKGLLSNLKEYINLTYSRFGILQVIRNSPIYLRVFLRAIKYKILNYAF
jgi:glycosyltransferase involved in cell wall biosynthesis